MTPFPHMGVTSTVIDLLTESMSAACGHGGWRPAIRPLLQAAFFCLLGSTLCAAPVSSESPFIPSAPAGQPAADSAGNYQLSGISSINSILHACIVDVSKKRSRWIAVGAQSEGIEVISCDFEGNNAVVKISGETKVLTLRKSTTQKASFTPLAVAPPPGAPPQNTGPGGPPIDPSQLRAPVTVEEKEREARMLVSDMLDITMRQRKAYEEAKRADDEAKKKDPGKKRQDTGSKK